ncbi:MAG TPA: glycosyltransferase [Sunxiuqinia sp.]|nr:glycosyltransferase [Sunxiuqinia sp.]
MKERVKTIKIIGPAYPYRGGIASGNERMAEEFIKEGYDVKIETFLLQYPKILFPGKTQYVDGPAPKNLSITRSINTINPLNWYRVGQRLKKEKPDLVIIRYWLPFLAPCLGSLMRLVRKNKHTRIICLADNIVPHEKRPGDDLFTRYFINSIDGLVAMSRTVFDDAHHFRNNLPAKQTVHPLFDNLGKKLPKEKAKELLQLDSKTNYMLFFGFIRDYKGLDLLLKAMADEQIKQLPVKLIVAGEFYSKPDSYFQQLEELNLKDRVIMRNDFIPDKEVTRFFSAADLVVQPYKSATQSGVTQIGYHFEKPMLVTNVGGLSEIIPDQKIGYVVDPNEKAIADAILDFYQNKRQKEFEKNILEEKKKFSWENMVNAITAVFQEIK